MITMILCLLVAVNTLTAHVRIGTDVCEQERQFCVLRKAHVKRALESLLNRPLQPHEVPTIALCSSGGGYRAMLATLGFLQGLSTPLPKKKCGLAWALQTGSAIWHTITHTVAAYLAYWLSSDDVTPELSVPEDDNITNIFDACTYCSCLSGSSWAVAGWLQSRMTLDNYIPHCAERIQRNLLKNFHLENVITTLAEKYANDQPISLVDIYGCLIAQTLLGSLGANNPNIFKLGSDQEYCATGTIPMPIHSAIIGKDISTYEWVEYTPWEVGSCFLQSFIPVETFNSAYNAGQVQQKNPVPSLGFCLGLWGSGMCINTQEFLALLPPHLDRLEATTTGTEKEILEYIEHTILQLLSSYGTLPKQNKNVLDRRLSPARIHNWNLNIPHVPLNTQNYFTIVDAGIDFRIALPPLLRPERAVDIIIMLDASDRALGTELHEAEAYAQRKGLKMPPIDYSKAQQPYSVHRNLHDPTAPILIYFPLIKNPTYARGWDPRNADFTATYNFAYTKEQSNLLLGLSKHTAMQAQGFIVDVIKQWVQKKAPR